MKTFLITFVGVICLCSAAQAGFLSGNSSPYVEAPGIIAFKLNTYILMVDTPFSSACLSGKYGLTDNICLSAKYGVGTIDYSTVTGSKLTTDPQLSGGGIEYLLSGNKKTEYTALVVEYETVSWSINRKSNVSNETLMGMDFSSVSSDTLRTRYRLALHNFNSGPESNEKVSTSVKYSFSSELEYNFSRNLKGCFEAGIFFGDPVGGLLACFGFGFGFNT